MLFSRADLKPRILLVDPKKSKNTVIVDWGFGGSYSEDWKYTKIYYSGVRMHSEQWFVSIGKYELERKEEEAI